MVTRYDGCTLINGITDVKDIKDINKIKNEIKSAKDEEIYRYIE